MAKEKIKLTDKEMESRLGELKIELLKQNSKKKAVKKEIARILTFKSLNKIAAEKNKLVEKPTVNEQKLTKVNSTGKK